MTPDQRAIIQRLVVVPGRPDPIEPTSFLREFGAEDGVQLGIDLLNDAVARQDSIDVEYALVVCWTFGFITSHLDSLLDLAYADWHHRHEDVAEALGDLRSTRSRDALVRLAERTPDYLAFDDSRALARKAIAALAQIEDGRVGHEALERLAQSTDPDLARLASHRLRHE